MQQQDPDISESINLLIQRCQMSGIDPALFIAEKLQELEERARAMATPSRQWFVDHAVEYEHYMELMYGRPLEAWEAHGSRSLSTQVRRRYDPQSREDLADDRFLKEDLLRESGSRCRSCGEVLDLTSIRIDHVIPLAEGGSNLRANLQALCEECNQGKADYFEATAVGALRPWFERRADLIEGKVLLTPAKRFCVLLRDGRRCRKCGRSSSETRIDVALRVGRSNGGQALFDNLMAVCEYCIKTEEDRNE